MNRSAPYRAAPSLTAIAALSLCTAQAVAQTTTAQTDDDGHGLDSVVVTANPTGSSKLSPPASVLQGRDLTLRQGRTIGETLDGMPGVSATGFGPGASRPIIRGLDGDRIRLLQNGVGALDASSLSFDHAVPQDMLGVDRVEVLRGPAALLYGGSAVGGVVNTIDGRIPRESTDEVSGQVHLGVGGASRERALAARLSAGNGRLAIAADGFTRQSSNLRIPGFAWSDRQRAGQGSFRFVEHDHDHGHDGDEDHDGHDHGATDAATARYRLPNSSGRADGGALGASLTNAHGYVGLSYGTYRAGYGSVAEPDVRLRMQQDKLALAGEQRQLDGPFSMVRFSLAHTDYQHRELHDGEVGTTFRNRGVEGRIEARHARIGKLDGTVGLQFGNSRFSALGQEAFVPSSRTRHLALFAVEEYAVSDALTWSLGLRHERTELTPDASDPRFAAASSRRFGTSSASTGVRYRIDPRWTLDGQLAYVERAPTYYELYANGEHVATGVYERGDGQARKERSVSTDVGLSFDNGEHNGRIGVYYTHFQNYLGLVRSGRLCSDGGEAGVLCDAANDEGRTEYTYVGIPARFYGIEGQARLHLGRVGTSDFDLELRGDLTRATRRDTGEALPRIPPVRLGAALGWRQGDWRARLDVQHVLAQSRVPSGDTRTDGYTLVGMSLAYSFRFDGTWWETYVRGTNLTNADARLATSMLRDIAPLGGRALWFGARMMF